MSEITGENVVAEIGGICEITVENVTAEIGEICEVTGANVVAEIGEICEQLASLYDRINTVLEFRHNRIMDIAVEQYGFGDTQEFRELMSHAEFPIAHIGRFLSDVIVKEELFIEKLEAPTERVSTFVKAMRTATDNLVTRAKGG